MGCRVAARQERKEPTREEDIDRLGVIYKHNEMSKEVCKMRRATDGGAHRLGIIS